jgi:hypothetical protein
VKPLNGTVTSSAGRSGASIAWKNSRLNDVLSGINIRFLFAKIGKTYTVDSGSPCFWDFQFLYRNTVQETWGIEGAVKLHGDGQLPQNLLSLAVDISP